MKTINWTGDELILLDQTLLPKEIKYKYCKDWREVAEAIKMLRVRGAPAIGVAAAYGFLLAARECQKLTNDSPTFMKNLLSFGNILRETRPTAVNLMWAIDIMVKTAKSFENSSIDNIVISLEKKARKIEEDDITLCNAIGDAGVKLFLDDKKYRILTHCNTGFLATAGIGTALGVIQKLHKLNKIECVYVDETRPLLQGARLTAFELMQSRIPAKLITDNMAAYVMQQGLIDAVIVGADRITTMGDVANKIGTYGVAVLAKAHNIPFYVAAPSSTFDFNMEEGQNIPIEQRDANEILKLQGIPIAPQGMEVLNPAFDVTPHQLINAIITEKGTLFPPYNTAINALKNN